MLNNLGEVLHKARTTFQNDFDLNEIQLPESFKQAFRAFLDKEEKSVQYTSHTTIITDKDNKRIFLPNQWFVIAGFITPFLKEVVRYHDLFIECVNKEYTSKAARESFIRPLKNTQDANKIESVHNLLYTYLPNDFRGDERERVASLITRFATDYSWWMGNKTLDRNDYFVSPALGLSGVINASGEYIARIAAMYMADNQLLEKLKDSVLDEEPKDTDPLEQIIELPTLETPRLSGGITEIVYGAPGTGKSRYLDNRFGTDSEVTRVVFHPEYTSFDFIGSYKPTTVYMSPEREIHYPDGIAFESGEPLIDYRFIPGPFISILVQAWLNPNKMYTLIIEEINRANAAAVFGEVFQLLDREPGGESEYGITPSFELGMFLKSVKGMSTFMEHGLKIPSNLNIVATMNSADQGVQPMDSAFKRRWNFRYMRIETDGAVHQKAIFDYAGNQYQWGDFVTAINKKLASLGFDEDRLVGTYFIKPGEVGNNQTTDKLLLYLWDDVLRYNRRDFFNPNVYTFGQLSQGFKTDDVLNLINTGFLHTPLQEEKLEDDNDLTFALEDEEDF